MNSDRFMAEDHSGQLRLSGMDSEKGINSSPYKSQNLMGNPAFLSCSRCEGMEYRLIMDQDDTGLVQFVCNNHRCGGHSPVFQLRVPQMNNDFESRMKNAGQFSVPSRLRDMGLMLPEDL